MDKETRKFLLKLANLMDQYDVEITGREDSGGYQTWVDGVDIDVGIDRTVELGNFVTGDAIRKEVDRVA